MINPEPEVFNRRQITYRLLRPSDLDTLERIHDELFPTRLDPDFYRDVVNGHNNIVSWGAVDSSRPDGQSDEIIGYITAEVTSVGHSEIADMMGQLYAELDDTTVVYVMTLGVVQKYRKLGIATSLLRKVIKYASDLRNCLAVYLHAVAINKPAVKLYKKMSFKCVKRLRGYYPIHGEYFDAFVFLLFLKPDHSCTPFFFREVFTSLYSYMVSGMKSVSLRS